MARVDNKTFRDALSLFPSGVVIATARDASGEPRGFTASSFSSVSMLPPLVLLCLNRTAQCYDCFETSERFAVSILKPEHERLAKLVATRGADKFAGEDFRWGPHDLPIVRRALAVLSCRTTDRHPAGDHTILIGEVESVEIGGGREAMVHYARGFWSVGTEIETRGRQSG
jgi:flavin reductase ActVB